MLATVCILLLYVFSRLRNARCLFSIEHRTNHTPSSLFSIYHSHNYVSVHSGKRETPNQTLGSITTDSIPLFRRTIRRLTRPWPLLFLLVHRTLFATTSSTMKTTTLAPVLNFGRCVFCCARARTGCVVLFMCIRYLELR